MIFLDKMVEYAPPDGRLLRNFTPDEYRLSGERVRSLMRKNRVTTRQLAEAMEITQKRVREVRNDGVEGYAYVRDYIEAIIENSFEKAAFADRKK
jgi:transcriptional regulator with XRE-family HTH domain